MPEPAFLSARSRARARGQATGFDFGAVALGTIREGEEQEREDRKTLRSYAEDIPIPGIGPIRWEDFPFQEEWYSEEVANAREVVIAKSAQVGASEFSWRFAVRGVDQLGVTGMYIFPTAEHVREFGDERIEPAIQESKYLLGRIPAKYVKTKSLKRIGRGFLHLRGSNSKAGAQSVAAQLLVFDEYDLLDQTNLVQIERRISGAMQIGRRPQVVRLGYPYTPNDGIDAKWKASDQRVWHVVCKSCGQEQPLVWEENLRWSVPGYHEGHTKQEPKGDSSRPLRVMRPGDDVFDDREDVEEAWRVCRGCEASLEDSGPFVKDGALRKGRWIPRFPGRPIIGFHAWRGMVPVTDLIALVKASRLTKEAERETFYVLDLGRPYVGGSASLTDDDLMAAALLGEAPAASYNGLNPTTMGVDIGDEKGIHVRVDEQLPAGPRGGLNPRRALWIGTVTSFEEVAGLIDRFGVHVCVVDANPERRYARLLRGVYPGRVLLCEYGGPFEDPLKLTTDDAGVPLQVRVNRTDAIDGMMDSIRQGRNRPLLPQFLPAGWMAQMKALVRKQDTDTKGRPYRHYVTTGTNGDDFAHADVYALVATEMWRALGAAQRRLVEAQGRPMTNREVGMQGVNLSGLGNGDVDYRPGFGEPTA